MFDLWVKKIPRRRKWQPTPVFLPQKIPWTEEPDGLQSMGLQRVGHDLATKPPQTLFGLVAKSCPTRAVVRIK